MNIAFFDFDGTMANGDSLLEFVAFVRGRKRLYWGLFSRCFMLIGYGLGFVSNAKSKQTLMQYFFAGMDYKEFLQECERFCLVLEHRLKPSALARLQWHKDRGDEVVMVSASFEEYLRPLCVKLGMECIGTRLATKPRPMDSGVESILSGEFATPNCYGEQKAVRIRACYELHTYTEIYAYGDSRGDKAMLELATHAFYKPF